MGKQITTTRDYATFLRDRVLYAYRNRCAVCKKWLPYAGWHLYHIASRGAHPELRKDPNNLMPLCAVCHTKVHTGFFPRARLELNRRPVR